MVIFSPVRWVKHAAISGVPVSFISKMQEYSQNLAAVTAYFNGWEMYQKVIQHNYMEHIEIKEILHQYLESHHQYSFSFLDLGCGDASFSSHLLATLSPCSYTGVDLASTALELASQNLSALKISVELKQEEIQNFLLSHDHQFDVILSAFSIHHLSEQQKETYLFQVKQHLNPEGVLLFVDVFREEGESRLEYIKRYSKNIHQYWTQLTSEVKESLIQHIKDSDYPEWESSLREWSKAAGFENVSLLYQGGHNTQKILAIY
jgi:ubiquinone/menaquinone biosynthesis C-methylase UbiE